MTPEQYLDNLPEERKKPLEEIRYLIQETYPDILENMDYRMPTYYLDEYSLFALASQKHFMALYVMPYDLLDEFEEELKAYNCGKSCIRFKQLDAEGLQLMERIIKYCGKNFPKSQFYCNKNLKKK